MKTFINSLLVLFIAFSLGCVDDNVVDVPVLPPSMVENFTATPGNAEVVLSWTINVNEKITEYEITYTPDGADVITLSNDKDTHTITELTNDTEYTFTLVAKNGTQSSEAATVKATPVEPNLTGPELSAFSFLAANNSNMALDAADVIDLDKGTIDQEKNTVTFSADDISAYVYLDALVPTFTVPEGAVVKVGEADQTSGTTAQDFTQPVQYDITLNGNTRTYTVTVSKSQFATIPDAAFVTKLKEFGMPFNESDQLDITSTTVTEYATDDKMNVDDAGIGNIKGFEFFIGVKELDAERNSFPSINVSRNTGLKNLLVGLNSEISSVEIGDKTTLEIVYINETPKVTDIQSIVNANTGLKRLYAQGAGITSVDVTDLAALERLRLSETVAKNSAASINAMLAKNPPIASKLSDLRVYMDDTGDQCGSYDPSTYECL